MVAIFLFLLYSCLSPFFLPCKSYVTPIYLPFCSMLWSGLATDLKRRRNGPEVNEKTKNTSFEKSFLRETLHPYTDTCVTYTMLMRYKDFKYSRTLHLPYINPTPFCICNAEK